MITLKPIEREIHRALRSRAQAGDPADPTTVCISYKELGLLVDPEGNNPGLSRPPFRNMFPALGHVSTYEVEHGRPMLSAMVVREGSRTPGSGYLVLARECGFSTDDEGEEFWQQQLADVIRLWSAGDPVLLMDAAVDRLMGEIASLKSLMRKR